MTAHGTPAAPEITAVVPTVGRSPWLAACLRALRRQGDAASLEILVVDQAPLPLALPAGLADRVLRPERNLGFAGGTNLGLAAARGVLLATVNDDAVVGPGWLAALTAALRGDARAAAVQGINVLADPAGLETGPDEHERIDGCGLGWNRWWQAIQIGHGEPLPATSAEAVEIFGVSATAALFRRSALERVALGGEVFDPRLVSYYEDSELAGRLRAAGFSALLVPAARARHLGSASGRTAAAGRERWRLIYGNRYLAAARLLGRGLWPRLPLMLLRDLLDAAGPAALLGVLLRRDRRLPPGDRGSGPGTRRGRLSGMAAGWGRALRHLPAFAHTGAPALSPAQVARLSRWPARWQP